MKRHVLLFVGYIVSFFATAQQQGEDITKKSYYSEANWSDESKVWLLAVFTVTCLVFTARTFRNKPEA